VAGRNGDIEADPERVSFLMRVVWLLDDHVATVDVVAEFFEASRFFEDELVDGVRFIDAAVGDVDW
jgi:hypothetical protein